ncbi:MAG: hypothetical protein WC866_00540 [Patescibacteria group bacterium]|jgi:hypothetical protein
MKAMTSEDLYEHLNTVIPDGRELVLVNVHYEVRNGLLNSEVIEGDPAAADSPNYDIVGVFGCVYNSDKPRFLAKAYDSARDSVFVMNSIAQKIDDLEVELTVEEKGALVIKRRTPTVAAAMIAAQDTDGNLAYILYRHPEVDRQRAILILKAVLRSASEAALQAEERESKEN